MIASMVKSAILPLLAALMVSAPSNVFAQDAPTIQAAFGYSYLTRPNAVLVDVISDEPPDSSSDEGGTAPGSGWFAEIVGNISSHAAIVGQVSATYTSGTLNSRGWHGDNTAYTFLGGGRASLRRSAVVPFAQMLAGWIRSRADVIEGTSNRTAQWSDYFAVTVGGGADIRIGSAVGIHLAADIMRTNRERSSTRSSSDRTWRLLAGLVVPM